MNLVYKIVLFSLLSICLPIGKLFEIFIWNDRITKTEKVFDKQRIESSGRICFFVKTAKKLKKKLSIDLQANLDFAIIERIIRKKNRQSIFVQNNKIISYKALLIRRFIFNTIYLDESDNALKPLL